MKNKLIKFTTSVLLVGLMVSATIEPAMAAESAVKFIVNDNSVKKFEPAVGIPLRQALFFI